MQLILLKYTHNDQQEHKQTGLFFFFYNILFAYKPNHTRQHKFCGRHKIISNCSDLDEKKSWRINLATSHHLKSVV